MKKRILVLHGPNINLTGTREPNIYGRTGYEEMIKQVERAAQGRGAFSERDGSLFWEVDASDMAAAASWAVAQGIEPVAPTELADAARELLEGVVGHAS